MLSVDRRTIWPRRTASNRTSTAGRWLTQPPRPLRFATVGGGCTVLQLLALALLVRLGVERHLANIFAFLLSAQVNFALSSAVTWRDRRAGAERVAGVTRQLAGYNALALGALAVNQAVFALTSLLAHYLAASALGILAGMFLTYTVSGRVIFRKPAGAPPAGHP